MPRLIPKTGLSAKRCRELFDYDAKTGQLIWKVPCGGNSQIHESSQKAAYEVG